MKMEVCNYFHPCVLHLLPCVRVLVCVWEEEGGGAIVPFSISSHPLLNVGWEYLWPHVIFKEL